VQLSALGFLIYQSVIRIRTILAPRQPLVFRSSPFALARFNGMASAQHQNGKHANKRAPAAITSLSAASRCASRPPSDPSV